MRESALVDRRPDGAEQALSSAVACGDVDQVRSLLEAGVCVDAVDGDGASPLMRAAERGDVATMRVLVEAGADVHLRRRKTGWSALMYALHADRAAAAMSLLEWGANPNAADDSGYSALMMAAGRGRQLLVRDLLYRGADPTAELFLGFTALDYAIGYGHADIVRLLIDVAPSMKKRRNGARRAVLTLAGLAGEDEILALLD